MGLYYSHPPCSFRRKYPCVVSVTDPSRYSTGKQASRPTRCAIYMATYFFASPVDVDVRLEGEDIRKKVDVKGEKDRIVSCPVYYDGDAVTGQVRLPTPSRLCTARCTLPAQVTVRVRDGKKIVHDGIKVEFVGNIGEPGSRRLGRASWALTDDGQSCSMIGAITRSFFRFRRSSRRRASCAKPRRSTFCSKMSRNSMRATRESTSSCGASCISPQLRVYR